MTILSNATSVPHNELKKKINPLPLPSPFNKKIKIKIKIKP
jgi:hypothetical protein